jgi:hypothetical protein
MEVPMSEYIRRAGIVNGVVARKHKSEYKNLRVDVTFDSEQPIGGYEYDEPNQIDEFSITLPIGSPVQPGDAVVVTMEFTNPLGQRFTPALEVGEPEVDEDVLVGNTA